ncbi:hypothetical protein ACOKFD_10730 [Flagellimonas sp. S174]|uniref:hypothetical protein n=1 Tax=Flagellimonas sp. S174 TaxID=3410790 RepID=UPI003BF50F25
MRNYIVFGFVLLYFVAMTRPVLPLMEYIIYEDYIAEFLCINKDRKELQCNGKCYLMQMLNEQNEDKKQNLPKIVLEEYPIGFVNLQKVSPPQNCLFSNSRVFIYFNPYSFLFTSGSFHPPSIIS